MAVKSANPNAITRKNADGVTYRIPMFPGMSCRLEVQNGLPTMFGSIVDLLGKYEQLGTPEELQKKLNIK